jgi:flagellum-specific peptidoglycan hydrolase FlgJ
VQSSSRARWQHATALVSLSTCGAMTGFSVAHSSVADLTSPSSIPVKLMAMNKPAKSVAASDSALRSAIVKAARYYLKLAQSRSPSAMEALIWQNDSTDGADHGQSCAAFASLTLQSGAQATGLQSWVSGGSTYPWPVQPWVDSRVDPNPQSMGVISILQDAQAHHRWHPIGDGYTPQPGDWVLFDGHVEVVTKYAGGVLYTIGGDSMPNMSVNAHQFAGPPAAQGVTGFVNNGVLLSAVSQTPVGAQSQTPGGAQSQAPGGSESQTPGGSQSQTATVDEPAQGELFPADGQAAVPGVVMPALSLGGAGQARGQAQAGGQAHAGSRAGSAGVAGSGESAPSAVADTALHAAAAIPGAVPVAGSVTSYSSVASSARHSEPASGARHGQPASGARSSQPASGERHGQPASGARYSRSQATPSTASLPDSSAQQAFIAQVAPGALAAQRQYGIPAAVTIAQAIDESGWGQSMLATQDNNLFGIKGTGPAGSVLRPTQEYQNGQVVTVNAPFRAYSSMAQSITDHSVLLATGSSYKQAMADRRSPDAFANDLTGVYATDPNYGASLITIMRQYNLYRFDAGASAAHGTSAGSVGSGAAQGGAAGRGGSGQGGAAGQGGAVAGSGAAQGDAAGRGGSEQSGEAEIPGAVAVSAAGLGLAPAQASGSAAGGPVASGSQVGQVPRVGQASRDRSRPGAVGSGEASIPGIDAYAGTGAAASSAAATSAHLEPTGGQALRAGPANLHVSTRRYVSQMPRVVLTDFVTTAKIPLLRAKPVYQQVADGHGVRWELLAACDWMQCQAQPGVSPVYGEDLGTKNTDGTVYRTKADALDQCAADLIELAAAVYGLNLRQRRLLSVRELANVFAAFRWGGLLKAHRVSAMDFPYSVEGLTAAHMKMRWPEIGGDAPDKPGTRFRMSFGAVPVVLRLNYPALA